MGGRSSSSTSQSSKSQNFDERIAATDDAVVVRNASGVTVDRSFTSLTDSRSFSDSRTFVDNRDFSQELDNGAIDSAFGFASDVAKGSLDFLSEIQNNFVTVTETATDAVNSTANRAFDFVQEQNETVEQNILKSLTPWIVVAVAVVVMTRGIRA